MPLTEAGIYYADTSTTMSIADITAAMATSMGNSIKVLQVVQGSTVSPLSNSSSTFVDTGLTATITPKFATSKILVIASHPATQKTNANSENRAQIRLMRGGTEVASTGNLFLYNGSAIHNVGGTVISFLDAPATTAATTYKTQLASVNNTAAIIINPSGSPFSSITLIEVTA